MQNVAWYWDGAQVVDQLQALHKLQECGDDKEVAGVEEAEPDEEYQVRFLVCAGENIV